ncbi:MAG: class I SAM-dependent methyltransferase, partial [Firmicutes bacterium]|nr:class I SAM-dependent methyltransferase [Bacillota bacterium]
LQNCNAKLFSTELNHQRTVVAKEFFKQSGLIDRLTLHVGDEAQIIPLMTGQFDFIFLDGAKTKYITHLPYLKKLLVRGGVLLADNVLFGGMVAGETEVIKTKSTIVQSLRVFTDAICSDTDFYTSIIPVGDGMSISIKS